MVRLRRTAWLWLALLAGAAVLRAQEGVGAIRGTLVDPSGAAVPNARIELQGPTRRTLTGDAAGTWTAEGLRAGPYTVLVRREGFRPIAKRDVLVTAGRTTALELALEIAPVQETVTVGESTAPLSLSPDENGGAIVIKGADLEALPDDPDEMADALQALAGPAAGPNGGQIFIDGFTGGRIPPKSAIREIRINANPFSAEYDRLGYGRIEIFTKPGSDHLRGGASFNFNNQSLNSRDPFAPNRPDYQRRVFGGNLSGPFLGKKASYFVDFERRAVDDTAIVKATVLDPDLQVVPFSQAFTTPSWRTTVSPRLDFQFGPSQTLTVRYSYTSTERDDSGIGGFSLPTRGYDATSRQHGVQLTETATFGKTISETRFRWMGDRSGQIPANLEPALQVQDAFSAGGAQVGQSSNDQDRLELQNVTSWAKGGHSFHTGFRLRVLNEDDTSRQSYGGSVTFAGALGPELDAAGQVVLGSDGLPVSVPLSSIERYRRTVTLQQLGLRGPAIRTLGGGATQLRLANGDPLASVDQKDLGVFFQDDWKLRVDFLVGLGLRYEVQDNVKGKGDLAPRLSFAWSPGATGKPGSSSPKTVVRGGFGIFYDRVGDDLVLDVHRLDGISRQTFLVTDPEVLDLLTFTTASVNGVPSAAQLFAFAQPQITRRLADDIQAPRTFQGSLSVERALPGNFTLTATGIVARMDRALRSRVLWAPGFDAPPPAGAAGPVYLYESTGRVHHDQIVVGVNNRLSRKLGVSFRYFYGRATNDTDGARSFPADPGDPPADWGRASQDVRHRLVLTGRVDLPWGLRASPFVIYSSAPPFNITTGADRNRDTVFTDRPAYAAAGARGAIVTPWGMFDPTPAPGQALIARNLGTGSSFFVVNLRLGKTIPLGHGAVVDDGPPDGEPGAPPGGGRRGPGGGGPGAGRPGGGGFGGGGGRAGSGEARGLTFSASVQNLFNHVNPGAPVGNLSSPFFGESVASAGGFGRGGATVGNRRIELQARLSF